jgi:hypothetical protein
MKTFYVTYTRYVTELEKTTIAVEAKNKEEALEKAKTGKGEEVNWKCYDRNVEDEYWNEDVEIEEEKKLIEEAL